jgi:S-adenosylmethionine-dependent methyltransferase
VVTGVDPSQNLLNRLIEGAATSGVSIEAVMGRLEDLDETLGARRFDVVCAHGLLMYADDCDAAVAALCEGVGPGGLLSLTFHNSAALASRSGVRGSGRRRSRRSTMSRTSTSWVFPRGPIR